MNKIRPLSGLSALTQAASETEKNVTGHDQEKGSKPNEKEAVVEKNDEVAVTEEIKETTEVVVESTPKRKEEKKKEITNQANSKIDFSKLKWENIRIAERHHEILKIYSVINGKTLTEIFYEVLENHIKDNNLEGLLKLKK